MKQTFNRVWLSANVLFEVQRKVTQEREFNQMIKRTFLWHDIMVNIFLNLEASNIVFEQLSWSLFTGISLLFSSYVCLISLALKKIFLSTFIYHVSKYICTLFCILDIRYRFIVYSNVLKGGKRDYIVYKWFIHSSLHSLSVC